MRLLAATGLAVLAGTQIVYLKDHLQGGDAYRMNTLFKFYNQVWVLWGCGGGNCICPGSSRVSSRRRGENGTCRGGPSFGFESGPGLLLPRVQTCIWQLVRGAWGVVFLGLLLCCQPDLSALGDAFAGCRSDSRAGSLPIGTLNGMAFMENGVYHWPDSGNAIELQYDFEAIQWLLENVQGNIVLAESAQVDYYRAGGTRVASLTGLSGLLGMHEGEQRYSKDVGERHGKLSEFWNTEDLGRIEALIDELEIGLIYVGQLERQQHPGAESRLAQLERPGFLESVYRNPEVTIYAIPSHIQGQQKGR